MRDAKREGQRDVQAELKALRLHGMASAWVDLVEQGGAASVESSRWLRIGFSNAIGQPKNGPEKAPGRARRGPQ